nr:hypothetical protein [Flavobacterium sp.]
MNDYKKYMELFDKGKEFDQILFLDNFYNNLSVDDISGSDLFDILLSGIKKSTNVYVKRSSFKFICDLTLIGKICNRLSTAGLVEDFILGDNNLLKTIGLKYLPYFPEVFTYNIIEVLKVLSDNEDGEISSQALVCLGLHSLSLNLNSTDVINLVSNIQTSKIYFNTAIDAVENRDDAEYYILLIGWIEAVISNDLILVKDRLELLEKSLLIRNLYERDGLELDFLIFQLIAKIKISFDISSKSEEWIDFRPNIKALMTVRLEIEKLNNLSFYIKGITNQLSEGIFENLQKIIYSLHLSDEKKRLDALKLSSDLELMNFIEKIIDYFPDIGDENPENYELLIALQQNLGTDEGIRIYKKIKNKEVSLEKAFSELLKNNISNQLSFKTGSILGHEILIDLTIKIDELLPNYNGEKRAAFLNVLEEVIRYTRSTLVNNDKKRFLFLYSKSEKGKGQDSSEQDLQNSMISYFEHSKIADGLEHEKSRFVDGGRVDILYKKDTITIPIELKKSIIRPDETILEQNYLAQAQTYTSGYDQLGIFVLLELSDKSKEPPANFKDWFKIHHLVPSTNLKINYPDYVVSVVIPGNRTGPSAKSTYK